jgi:hypothetical protein
VDFDQVWLAARALRAGQDPYLVVGPGKPYPFGWPLYYPGTAAVIAVPFSFLPVELARLSFVLLSGALFGYAIGKHRPYLWPALLSTSFLVGARNVQWSLALTAGMIVPALGWLAAAKPNLGVTMLAASKTRAQAAIIVVGGVGLVLVALAVDPDWPLRWGEQVREAPHFTPLLLRPGGFLMLLGLLRWRDPDARMLLGLAIVPSGGMFYDALPALLVARSRMQAVTLALLTQIASVAVAFHPKVDDWSGVAWATGKFVLWGVLLPALGLVLSRKEAA